MKRNLLITLCLALLIVSPSAAVAAEADGKKKPLKELTREQIAKLGGFEPAPENPVQPVGVQIELIVAQVPKADVLALSDGFKNPDRSEATFRELNAMIKAKKAKLLSCPTVETKSGNRCVIEIIQEVRYATEFSPQDGGKVANPAPAAEKAGPVKAPPHQMPAAIGVVPTAFETRNTGVTLEVEPILGPDGKMVDMTFSPQHVELLGWDTQDVEENGKLVQRIPQPRFHTNKVTSTATVRSGERILAGVFESGSVPDMMEIFLVKATTRMVKLK